MNNLRSIIFPLVVGIIVIFTHLNLFALVVGDTVENVTIWDANNNTTELPDFGKKVLVIFYNDPDVSSQNDPFADLLKKKKLNKSKYRPIGIANCKDTWKPNMIIRMVIRKKVEKYKSTILIDTDQKLKKTWKIGNCNEKSVIIVIGKDKKVYYFNKGPIKPEYEREKVVKLIKDLMDK